jgi:hypothetical protein
MDSDAENERELRVFNAGDKTETILSTTNAYFPFATIYKDEFVRE